MKKAILWTLAILITIGSAIYQRETGPTYPKKVEINIGNKTLSFKLPTSGETGTNQLIQIPDNDTSITVNLKYKRFPVNETFSDVRFLNTEEGLLAYLPQQPPAGKLEYYLTFKDNQTDQTVSTDHVIIRFKGKVPGWVLIPHIFFFNSLFSSSVNKFLASFNTLFKIIRDSA